MKTLLPALGILFKLTMLCQQTHAQEAGPKLIYAKTTIEIPTGCSAKSEYEILDCNGFSAQWLFLNEEMVKQGIQKQLLLQMDQQLQYKMKKSFMFTSQGQKFKGNKYTLADGKTRIIGFGKVDDIPLILNLGFDKNPKNNDDLTDFEKNFIAF